MHCFIVTDRSNTVGLATETKLLKEFLLGRGFTASVKDWREAPINTADVVFYLEKFSPAFLSAAKHHIGIFNPEWFDPAWLAPVRAGVTQIWAKSTAAFQWFTQRACDQVRFTGFLSRDPYDPAIKRERRALHLAGRSSAKNTTAVLRAYWDAHEQGIKLPDLVVVSHTPITSEPPGMIQYNYEVAQDVIDRLLNECRFHVCPSEIEGWGHYITEATACGGIVITTDASPMHEHVLPTFGYLISPMRTWEADDLERCSVSATSVMVALSTLNVLPDQMLDERGVMARAWNQKRNAAFEASATAALARLADA